MADSEILNQMIRNTAKLPLQMQYGKPIVTLDEPQSPNSSVTIAGMPSDAIIIKIDMFNAPDAIFCGSKGECKRADYVIISPSRRRILYIELKKKKDSAKGIIQQLKGAKCFVRYCKEIGRSFWEDKKFLENYHHRFISIGHISIAKGKTRIVRESDLHDTPEKALKIDWPHYLQFNHLAGKS